LFFYSTFFRARQTELLIYYFSTKLYQGGKELNNEKLHQAGADFARRTYLPFE